MKTFPLCFLLPVVLLTISGCAPRPATDKRGNTAPPQDDRSTITNDIHARLREFAIAERQAVDKARDRPDSMAANVDQTYAMYRDSWKEMFALIRSDKLSGTRDWTTAEKEELIAYALLQRKQLQLPDLNIDTTP